MTTSRPPVAANSTPADGAAARSTVGGAVAFGLVLALSTACDDPSLPALRVGTACPAVVMREVNDRWLAGHPEAGDNRWARAVYFTGDLAAYEATGDARYLDYAVRWSEANGWRLNGGAATRNADNHAAGQTYLALYELDPAPERIAELHRSIETVVLDAARDDWWWADAQYMASPVFARLGRNLDDPRYFDAMHALFVDARDRRGLFDPTTGLWFRDERYLFPASTTPHGKKIFWARGNGWVIASLVRTLVELPSDSPYRADYENMLAAMAPAVAERQRADGFWNVSLDDPLDFGGPESSGTSLFTYAIAWGIRADLLDRATYLPVVEKAWLALVERAVLADGRVGLVQGEGEAPRWGQPVELGDSTDFGVGVFLLAGSEVARLGLDLGCP